jgi:hypothetical protein
VKALDDLARFQLVTDDRISFHDWHQACTEVVPVRNEDFVYEIKDIWGLVRYLAEEHASLLLTVKPVQLVYGNSKEPFIANQLDARRREKAEHYRIWQAQHAKQVAEYKKMLREKEEKHPRYGEFDEITAKELEHLLWQKPTREIAAEFGISDVAIGKRCRRDGIKKPPRGFWAQVKAGKRPHPKGVPAE